MGLVARHLLQRLLNAGGVGTQAVGNVREGAPLAVGEALADHRTEIRLARGRLRGLTRNRSGSRRHAQRGLRRVFHQRKHLAEAAVIGAGLGLLPKRAETPFAELSRWLRIYYRGNK